MQPFHILLSALAITPALARNTIRQRQDWIVTFPKWTSDNVVAKAIEDMEKAQGKLVHQFKFVQGFICNIKIGSEMFKSLSTAWKLDTKATVETDSVVTMVGS